MSELISKLIKEQQSLTNECKRGIEANKLSLWSYKAELGSLESQFKRCNLILEEQEKYYSAVVSESRAAAKEASLIAESFNKFQLRSILEIINPWPLLQDLSIAICLMIGYSTGTWSTFRRVIKDCETFQETLQSFDPQNLEPESLDFILQIQKKHNLSLMIRDGRIPDEIVALSTWVMKAYTYTVKDMEAQEICEKMPTLVKEQAEVYLDMKSIKEDIAETEARLTRLISCIESAEANISRLKEVDENSPQDIENASSDCKKIDSIARSSINLDQLLTKIVVNDGVNAYWQEEDDSQNPSLLVESLFISHNLSPDLKEELKLIVNPTDEDEGNVDLENDVVDRASLISMQEVTASKNTFTGKKTDIDNKKPSKKNNRKIKEEKIKIRNKKKCCGFV
ncbi:unnamed protein product [Blepharisma stoltei]|uniref:Uncharacterized protein n=1 Tax=Blepharisma stoltei TaxID=1481888 RepID=A0AAU9JHE5_9CILI|nr:unnamed protein product [Blepharisma stoltei]